MAKKTNQKSTVDTQVMIEDIRAYSAKNNLPYIQAQMCTSGGQQIILNRCFELMDKRGITLNASIDLIQAEVDE